jgi:hypothetical protein
LASADAGDRVVRIQGFIYLNLKSRNFGSLVYMLSRFITAVNHVADLKESHKGYGGEALKEKFPSEHSTHSESGHVHTLLHHVPPIHYLSRVSTFVDSPELVSYSVFSALYPPSSYVGHDFLHYSLCHSIGN